MVLYSENKNPCDRAPFILCHLVVCFLLYLRLLLAHILAVADKMLAILAFCDLLRPVETYLGPPFCLITISFAVLLN